MAVAGIAVRPRATVLVAIAAAWTFAVAAQASGGASRLHHDWLIDGGLPLGLALAIFVLVWQAHVAAMMLPSSLPMIALFDRASAAQPNARWARLAFLGGYAAVWTTFGAGAFMGDVVLHRLVHRSPWLEERGWLITGTVLALAGAFQFSGLKDRCLQQCRHPGAFILRHYERGVVRAYRLGRRHGLFCLGCCWALMLVMFAVGVTNLLWMAPLAVVMVVEKTSRRGAEVTAVVGGVLLALSALVFVHPTWLPAPLGG